MLWTVERLDALGSGDPLACNAEVAAYKALTKEDRRKLFELASYRESAITNALADLRIAELRRLAFPDTWTLPQR